MKNIIIVSMETCGCSYLGIIISAVHEWYTGKRIYWNYEISRLHAIDSEYNFPKGFSSVYYVNPLDLLKRGYDKIIILKREKDDIIQDLCRRNKIEPDREKYPEMFEKIDFYYDLIYNFNNPYPSDRLMIVNLDDLNNYTVATFSDLFDFLEYPKKIRPLIIPLPVVNRDWKKFASILRKGHEEGEIEKDEYSQMVNVEKPNPYKLAPEEYYYQEGKVYRITPKPMVDTLEVLGKL